MSSTIRDVAQEAGVSASTVSRVYNNRGIVKSDTLNRILEAAEKLNYIPNATARSLSIRRTHALGCIVPEPSREFFSEILRGADEAAQAGKHHLLIASTHNDRETTRHVLHAMNGRVDGVLVVSPLYDAAELAADLPPDVPAVFLYASTEGTRYDEFRIDNEGGAHAATQHLIARGHRRIGLVLGQQANRDTRERAAGYRRALSEAGIEPSTDWTYRGDYTQQSGLEAGQWFAHMHATLPTDHCPTAVFAVNDYMALGVMGALQQAGIAIPEQVAVAGFDDILSARYAQPALTSVCAPAADAARKATERLIELGTSFDPQSIVQRRVMLPAGLVVRSST